MIDYSTSIDEDELLEKFNLRSGCRRVVNIDVQRELLEKLDGRYQIRAGSSMFNSLAALSKQLLIINYT